MSLRGQGEGRRRRTRTTTQTLGAKATMMRRMRRKRRPAHLWAAGAQVPAHPAPAWGRSTLLLSTRMGASKLTVRSPQAEASAASVHALRAGEGGGGAPGTQHTLSSHPGSGLQLPSRGGAREGASPGRGSAVITLCPPHRAERSPHTAHHPEILQGRWLLGEGVSSKPHVTTGKGGITGLPGCFLNSLILTLATP